MRALSIRQPFAELILRGIKTAEFRTRPTRIIGERFWIYACKGQTLRQAPFGSEPQGRRQGRGIWSRQLAVPACDEHGRIEWMIELAEQIKLIPPELQEGLPRGVIVGSAVVSRCEEVASGQWPVAGEKRIPSLATEHRPPATLFKWHLTDIQRAKRLRKPKHHPQPGWFNPF